MNNQLMNEAVYLHSHVQANVATCAKRFNYWYTIHKHRAEALDMPVLIDDSLFLLHNAAEEIAMLRRQAI